MPISVVCTGCKKRFSVSEKFAGQKGPCPSCKAIIQIPAKAEEVVIHAPEEAGPKDSQGKAVLKPILREETRFNPKIAAAVGVTIIALFIAAWIIGSVTPGAPAGLGVRDAILLAGLGSLFDHRTALEATILFRGLSVVIDLAAFLIGLLLLRATAERAVEA